jgi:hypothetical protein
MLISQVAVRRIGSRGLTVINRGVGRGLFKHCGDSGVLILLGLALFITNILRQICFWEHQDSTVQLEGLPSELLLGGAQNPGTSITEAFEASHSGPIIFYYLVTAETGLVLCTPQADLYDPWTHTLQMPYLLP